MAETRLPRSLKFSLMIRRVRLPKFSFTIIAFFLIPAATRGWDSPSCSKCHIHMMPRYNTSGYVPFDSIGTLCLIVSSRYLRVFKFDGQFQKQPIHLIFFWLDVHLPTLSFATASQHVATLTNSFRWSFTTLDREMRLLAYISRWFVQ
jgi:hypothetical protein